MSYCVYHILTASLVSKLGPKLILIEIFFYLVSLFKNLKFWSILDDFMKSGLQTQPIIFFTPKYNWKSFFLCEKKI